MVAEPRSELLPSLAPLKSIATLLGLLTATGVLFASISDAPVPQMFARSMRLLGVNRGCHRGEAGYRDDGNRSRKDLELGPAQAPVLRRAAPRQQRRALPSHHRATAVPNYFSRISSGLHCARGFGRGTCKAIRHRFDNNLDECIRG